MDFEFLKKLVVPAETKIVMLVLDGEGQVLKIGTRETFKAGLGKCLR